jgi:hypothetical protein
VIGNPKSTFGPASLISLAAVENGDDLDRAIAISH